MVVRKERKSPARQALLAAGRDILKSERGDLTKVKMNAVVEAAGLTSGAFYYVFPAGQDEFYEELMRDVVDRFRDSYVPDFLTKVKTLGPQSGDPLRDLELAVQAMAKLDAHLMADDYHFPIWLTMWARQSQDDPELTEALGDSYRTLQPAYVEAYEAVLAAWGREMRHPFDTKLLATVITALAEGLALRGSVDASAFDFNTGNEFEDWDLGSLLIFLLLALTTRGTHSLDQRSALAVARDLLGEA